jgi:hypothetical protein
MSPKKPTIRKRRAVTAQPKIYKFNTPSAQSVLDLIEDLIIKVAVLKATNTKESE